MQPNPFADVQATPANHFKLCFYGAMLRVIKQVAQTLGSPAQLQPCSTSQAAEQPSPEVLSPSSHASAPATTLSPQVVKQLEGWLMHL